MNVESLLARAALRAPEDPAIRFQQSTLTYGEFHQRVSQLASGLASRGVSPGDRVAILMRNRPELLETLFACFAAGLVAVPLNVRLHPMEIAYIVDHSRCEAIVFSPELRHAAVATSATLKIEAGDEYEAVLVEGHPAFRAVDVAADQLAWLFYTSGTTGHPKGAMLTHGSLTRMVIDCLAQVTSYRPDDIVLHAAPLTHGAGLYALAAIARGSCNLVHDSPRFDPSGILRTVAEKGVTVISFFTPTMIAMLLNCPDQARFDTTTLRSIAYGGGPMYVDDMLRALERFGPIFTQIYGQGESPMTISYLSPRDHQRGPALLESAGCPHPDIEVRITDDEDRECAVGTVGEVCVRGDVVMPGYWEDPVATKAALRGGWLHTGDLGRLDGNGYLYLLDRKKDLIISGGSNIYPREIEEVLLKHPDIQEATVIGVPDRLWGEAVHAIVVPRPGRSPSADELIAFCEGRLGSYKKPRSVEFVAGLPKNAYGKVLKRELRDRHWSGHTRRI